MGLSANTMLLIVFSFVLMLTVLLSCIIAIAYGGSCKKYIYQYLKRRRERKSIKHLQRHIRRTQNMDQWWHAVCEAARQIGLAKISFTTTHRDGRVNQKLWQVPRIDHDSVQAITMTIALAGNNPPGIQEFEIAVPVTDSIEAANACATLFARFLDASRSHWRLGTTDQLNAETESLGPNGWQISQISDGNNYGGRNEWLSMGQDGRAESSEPIPKNR